VGKIGFNKSISDGIPKVIVWYVLALIGEVEMVWSGAKEEVCGGNRFCEKILF